MSRRGGRTRSVGYRRHRGHGGLSGGAAALIFVVLCFLLGGVANAVPKLTGIVGFLALVVALLCWIATGTRRH